MVRAVRAGSWAAGVVVWASAWLPAAGAGAAVLKPIAYRGLPVPVPGQALVVDQLRPASFLGFRSAPVINAGGDIAFWAKLEDGGTGQTVGDSIWSYSGGALSPIAVAGGAVVGTAGGVFNNDLGRRVIIDAAGNVAYGAEVDLPGGTVRALLVGGAAADRLVVIEGQTVPQSDPLSPAFGFEFFSIGFGGNFLAPFSGDEYTFNGNNLAFRAAIREPGGFTTFSPAIYVERPTFAPTELKLVARAGSDTSFSPASEGHSVSPSGEVIFRTIVRPGGGESNFNAIATFNQANISFIAQTGSDAGGDVSFTALGNRPGFNAAGQAVFAARFSDLGASDSGLFKSQDPDGIIATEGIVAAGAPDLNSDGTPDFVFGDFLSVEAVINGRGHAVFHHTARTPDGSQSVTGLWSDRFGGLIALDPIAMVGDPAPGLPEGTVFTTVALNGVLQSVVINGNDDVAFIGQFRRPDNTIGTGIWAERDGVLELVAASGQEIALPDGTSFTVTTLDFMGGTGNQDGRPSGFSDNGQLVFRADGSAAEAFILAQVGPVAGDLNGDGFVGAGDLDVLLGQWNQGVLPGSGADLTGDGFVGAGDLDVLLGNWNGGLTPAAIPVPEPAALGVLALGAAGLMRRRGA